ncbi:hypothetical protein TNIN_236811 [Trichonephila inaurata madagascariensis]|uniref:Uncharacterized protein n=1 Tax=Trichonephila inaurata madagascariensis TaxID=2747483 RepID=A0A8X6XIF1_9ARAC|nr:hypothetical protein TNIN_236811 [Trichonephila inaurata madagascariensis]
MLAPSVSGFYTRVRVEEVCGVDYHIQIKFTKGKNSGRSIPNADNNAQIFSGSKVISISNLDYIDMSEETAAVSATPAAATPKKARLVAASKPKMLLLPPLKFPKWSSQPSRL